MSMLPQQGSFRGQTDAYLRPDLVVPPDHESTLRVHINPMSSFHLADLEGNQLFRVELKVEKTNRQERRRVVLVANDGRVLAQCVATPCHGSVPEFELWRFDDKYFAKLLPVRREEMPTHSSHHERPEAWTVRTITGAEWFFCGQFGRYPVDVMDVEVMNSQGSILAWAQAEAPTGMKAQHSHKSYLLRVASTMDISIVLCSLLAINHLMSL